MRAESDPALREPEAGRPLAPFGEVLRHFRRTAGFTQEQLAERTGLTREAISLLERGARQRPHPYTVQALCAALRLSPVDSAIFVAAARSSPDVSTPPMRSAVSASPLVGRVAELALIERQLHGAGPALLVLAGEPGIGKSRLLAEARARAAACGWTALDGGCQRGGQDPYAPLVQALERHLARQQPARRRSTLAGCAWLVRLLPEVADLIGEALPAWPLPPEQERRLMFAAVGRFLSGVAGPDGTLLVLDDLQWAGGDALGLLATLGRAVEVPIRVIGAYRDTEAPPQSALATMLADLAHAGLIAHHTIQPLSIAEATQILANLLEGSADDEAVRRRVVQRTGGVPFFLVSCALALRSGSRGAGADDVVPWDVAQSVRQRMAALSDDVREVLGVAAVVGRLVPYALLTAACSLPAVEVAVALHAACGSRLLEEAGADAYQFAHDVIREVIEADLGAARRLLLHGRIAQALEHAGPLLAGVEALAYHYSRSAEQDKAVLYLEQAGDRARDQYAHAAAVGYYGEAVRRLDRQGRALDAARVCEWLGGVLLTAGQYDQALEALEPAVETYRAAGDLDGQGHAGAAGGAHATNAGGAGRTRRLAGRDRAVPGPGQPLLSPGRPVCRASCGN